jgi:hypothetical protein
MAENAVIVAAPAGIAPPPPYLPAESITGFPIVTFDQLQPNHFYYAEYDEGGDKQDYVFFTYADGYQWKTADSVTMLYMFNREVKRVVNTNEFNELIGQVIGQEDSVVPQAILNMNGEHISYTQYKEIMRGPFEGDPEEDPYNNMADFDAAWFRFALTDEYTAWKEILPVKKWRVNRGDISNEGNSRHHFVIHSLPQAGGRARRRRRSTRRRHTLRRRKTAHRRRRA